MNRYEEYMYNLSKQVVHLFDELHLLDETSPKLNLTKVKFEVVEHPTYPSKSIYLLGHDRCGVIFTLRRIPKGLLIHGVEEPACWYIDRIGYTEDESTTLSDKRQHCKSVWTGIVNMNIIVRDIYRRMRRESEAMRKTTWGRILLSITK